MLQSTEGIEGAALADRRQGLDIVDKSLGYPLLLVAAWRSLRCKGIVVGCVCASRRGSGKGCGLTTEAGQAVW